jgi:hypothetical protein
VDSLVSAIDGLAAEDVESLDVASLGGELVELRRAADRLEAEFVRRLASFDRRGGADAEVLPTSAWLRHRCRLSAGAATARVMLARRLAGLPETTAAFAAGDIGLDHARTIALVRETPARAAVAAAEAEIVDYARRVSPAETARLIRHVVHAASPEVAVRDAARLHDGRWLSLSETFEGAWAVDGLLDPEAGATLRAALHAAGGVRGADDPRTAAQARADALAELARGALDGGGLPGAGGERPHLTVTVGLATLEARAGSPATELGWGGTLCGEAARRLACDATVTRVITGGDSLPLDVGRTTRVVPPPLRRALELRDRGCAWPGCDRPPPWTDAHHITHWADNGPTSLENLVLLCRRHHRAVHEGRAPSPEPPASPHPRCRSA